VPDLPAALQEARPPLQCAEAAAAAAQGSLDAFLAAGDDATAGTAQELARQDLRAVLDSTLSHLEHVRSSLSSGAAAQPCQLQPPPSLTRSLGPQMRASAALATEPESDGAASRLHALSSAVPGKAQQATKDAAPRMYNALALQLWILVACQTELGLRDKPGKSPDYYHTCYCLSGLSSSQHAAGRALGLPSNTLAAADPRLNVTYDRLHAAAAYFDSHPPLP